jgi:hypothetical protein
MYCQNFGNTWVFGDSVGLSFNSGMPVVLTQPVLSSHEPSSSISDSSGNLLFYVGAPTNFASSQYYIHKVWSQNNQIMLNGDSLIGHSSYTQGVVIIQDILNLDYYYIFHIGFVNGIGRHLYYSVVDMSANSGLGAVVLKNIQLQIINNNLLTEKMIVVRHGNGRDWWLIVHDLNSNFCSFLISPFGISTPNTQDIGTVLDFSRNVGQMQISPNGMKLVVAGDNALDLFDFDRCTGIISNWEYLGDTLSLATAKGYYGCSFSPNSQLLYVSTLDTLFQYDLNAVDIRNSRIVIFNDTCPVHCHIGQHLLGPDNKIYIANASGYGFGNTIYDAFNMSISYIENPNASGLSCDFYYLGQYLGGKRSFFGLPNIPNFGIGPLSGTVCDTLTGINELFDPDTHFTILPNPNNGNFKISYLLQQNQSGRLEISDMNRKKVFEMLIPQGSVMQNILLPNITDGVYIATLTNNSNRINQKLVIFNK